MNTLRSMYTAFHQGERLPAEKLFLALSEGPRVFNEILLSQLSKRVLAMKSSGNKQGIIVIPGFLGSDDFNQPLINFLNSLGHTTSGWMNGRNFGPRGLTEKMQREVEFKVQQTGAKITLIGHSLGGIYAREIARAMPEHIERVITLGSPLSNRIDTSTTAGKYFRAINQFNDEAQPVDHISQAPSVPISTVFTRSDSVIKWQSALQHNGHDRSENIEVYGSHCGLTQNAAVWYLLLDRLAQSSEQWQKFDNSSWRKTIYPMVQLSQHQ